MPKSRHKKRKHKNRPGSLLLNVAKDLERIEALIDDGDLIDAQHELKKLALSAPHRAEVFESSFFVAMQLEDKLEMLNACLRLTELQPYIPAHFFNLYGVYKKNFFPGLALQAGRYFLRCWPDSELGKDISEELEVISSHLQEDAVKLQFPEDAWLDCIALHEKVQVETARHGYKEAQQLATELLTRAPQFVPAYNNRSLAFWAEGKVEEAIADARKALEIMPHNVHALGNLTRYLRLANRIAEAREIAEVLKNAQATSPDTWMKKAEAFSYLADDATVLEIAEQAEKAGVLFGEFADPALLHLAGVAAGRLGDEKKAKRFWDEAVKRAPSFGRAQAQLDDLDRPISERDGPWPFTFQEWIIGHQFGELANAIERMASAKSDKHVQATLRLFLDRNLHIAALVPVLLERGDPPAREFALRLAQTVEMPELIDALKRFAQSANGPDELRQDALTSLQRKNVFEKDRKVRIWQNGQEREVILQSYTIDGVPYEKLSGRAQELSAAAIEAMLQDDLERAEELFKKALACAPDSVSLQFNKATIHLHLGDPATAKRLMQEIAERHPRYVFAKCQLLLSALANDRKEEALAWLKDLLNVEHFHFIEFADFCRVQIFYYLIADPNHDAAKHWLDMWEKTAPDDPKLDTMISLVESKFLAGVKARDLLLPYRED